LLLLLLLPAAGGRAAELAADGKPIVTFGVIPRYNPMVMYRNYQPIMDYLTEQTSYHFELKLSRNYTEAVEFLRIGVTQIASLGDVTFIEAYRSFGAIPILKPLNVHLKPYYRSVIILPEDSPVEGLSGLRGKRFAFGSPHSTSGNLIPRNYLYTRGITLFDLGSYDNLESHDAVVKAVLKGKADAGAVKDVVAQRYLKHGLRFLASSEPIPSVPIVVRKDTPAQLVKEIKQALLAIDARDREMVERMKNWDPEFRYGFVDASIEDYKEVIEIMDGIPEGCGVRCH
jgi:phosphonate transport system substrate-binding protein